MTRPSKLHRKLRTCKFCVKCARAVLMSDNTMQQRGAAVSASHCRKAENNESTEPNIPVPLLHGSSCPLPPPPSSVPHSLQLVIKKVNCVSVSGPASFWKM